MARASSALIVLVLWAFPLSAAAPQLYGQAGTFAINPYTANWTCSSETILGSDENCKNTGGTVGHYRFFNADIVLNPNDDRLYWYVTGDGRWGGPGGVCGAFDNILVFRTPKSHSGRRGAGLELMNSCPEIQPKTGGWQTHSAYYDQDFNAIYVNVIWTDTGSIETITEMEFRTGKTVDGWSNFNWSNLLRAEAPSGICSGIYQRIFAPVLTPDPTKSFRWVGFFTWRSHDSAGTGCAGGPQDLSFGGLTPWYVDWATGKLGIRFENEGWCEFPIGANFVAYDETRTCSNAGNGGGNYTLPDKFYREDSGDRVQDISEIDGKLYALRFDDSGSSLCGTDTECIKAHEPCTPTQDAIQAPTYGDYVTRRNSYFEGSGRYQIRELDPVNVQLVGTWVNISDGASAPVAFPMDPMDRSTDGYWNTDLIQFPNGEIALYRGIKHTICDDAWGTFPRDTSGTGLFFQVLSTSF